MSEAGLLEHVEQGARWPALLWTPGPGWRMLSTAVLGGGWGERHWVLNAQVPPGYGRTDPADHLAAIAAGAGATGPGVGLMTAAHLTDRGWATDGGVHALVTAGVGVHGWAAAPTRDVGADAASDVGADIGTDVGPRAGAGYHAGTVNIVFALPVPLSPSALVNAVTTATEAKVQALRDAGYDASGTPTDAVCAAAPDAGRGRSEDPFAG
ncbi:adenosylcobinamide amidohydrolase, partial [Streptomyces oceani]